MVSCKICHWRKTWIYWLEQRQWVSLRQRCWTCGRDRSSSRQTQFWRQRWSRWMTQSRVATAAAASSTTLDPRGGKRRSRRSTRIRVKWGWWARRSPERRARVGGGWRRFWNWRRITTCSLRRCWRSTAAQWSNPSWSTATSTTTAASGQR